MYSTNGRKTGTRGPSENKVDIFFAIVHNKTHVKTEFLDECLSMTFRLNIE